MIGQSPRRKEDERLVVGRGRFVDDIRLPSLLHVAFARSTHARARLVRVDVSAAQTLPGVMAFVADDFPELADCGRQLHPVIVDGQVMGGFVQGLGVSLGERIIYDDAGQLLTGSLVERPDPPTLGGRALLR